MNEYNLKIVISVLAGVTFAFLFILLALLLPVDKVDTVQKSKDLQKPTNRLEKVSKSMRENAE
ncbi:MAG: hypothetical protein JXQ66_01050 [Campylobacterales bacterium]|nr:hypothetical protein [Campylobacterales bacterium]